MSDVPRKLLKKNRNFPTNLIIFFLFAVGNLFSEGSLYVGGRVYYANWQPWWVSRANQNRVSENRISNPSKADANLFLTGVTGSYILEKWSVNYGYTRGSSSDTTKGGDSISNYGSTLDYFSTVILIFLIINEKSQE